MFVPGCNMVGIAMLIRALRVLSSVRYRRNYRFRRYSPMSLKTRGARPFVEFQIMIRDAIEQHVFRNDLPVELISKSLAALVEAMINLTVSNPSRANKYRDSGFQMFWAGITK
jgi:hypothetical protein